MRDLFGFGRASAKTIVMLDRDLQNDPEDIPAFADELNKVYNLSCGWHKDRKEAFWKRRLPIRIANELILWFADVRLRDYGY